LLQNLFANTLLNDDFAKKSDFDLGLGFDNLQLNYDTTELTPTLTSSSVSSSNNNTASNSNINSSETSTQIISELIKLNTTTIGQENSKDIIISLNEKKEAAVNDENLKLKNSNVGSDELVIQDLRLDNFITLENVNIHPIVQEANSSLNLDQKNDDKFFKKPLSNDFITLTTLNNSELFISSSDFVCPIDLLNKQNSSQSILNEKSASIILTNITGKLKKPRKRSKFLNMIDSNSKTTGNVENKKLQESKTVKLKQSKLSSSLNSANNLNNTTNGAQFFSSSSKKSTDHKLLITNKQNKITRLKLENIGKEPLSKKFAASNLNSTTSLNSSLNNKNNLQVNSCEINDLNNDKNVIILQNLRKDEVDLHIKELSLLDLHSSEDDTSTDFVK
jgi:hypothetical protein